MPTNTLIALAVLCAALAFPAAYTVRIVRAGRTQDPRIARLGGLLGRWTIEAFYWPLRKFGTALARTGLSPDFWTILSVLVTAFTLPLAALGHFALTGFALLLGAALDALDGVVARERGVASSAGAMLDSFVDRYADAVPLIGLALYFRGSAWHLLMILVALVGGQAVSYARARAEGLGAKNLPSGIMRRHERITILALALLVGPLFSVPTLAELIGPQPLTFAPVALMGLLSHLAALQLLLKARKQLSTDAQAAPVSTIRRTVTAEAPTTPASIEHEPLTEARPSAAE